MMVDQKMSNINYSLQPKLAQKMEFFTQTYNCGQLIECNEKKNKC